MTQTTNLGTKCPKVPGLGRLPNKRFSAPRGAKIASVATLALLALVLFIGGQTLGGVVFLVLAFLVSPYGVPVTADWLVARLHSLNYTLRDFITG